jgi:molecular chaperone HscB
MSDAFELLGAEPTFELDLKLLEQRHRELSKALHPDRYAGRPAGERRAALGKAIEVNDAWRTLRDPVRRAEALLGRLGLPPGLQQRQPSTDPELLMELMELREKLAEVRARRQPAELESLAEVVRRREAELLDRMAKDFAHALRAGTADPRVDGCVELLLRELGELRYYRKFLEDVGVVEDELY